MQSIIVTVMVEKGQCHELFMAVFSGFFLCSSTHMLDSALRLLDDNITCRYFLYSLAKRNSISRYTDPHSCWV